LNAQNEKGIPEERRSFDFAQDDRMKQDDRMIVISLQMSDEPDFSKHSKTDSKARG